MVPEEAWLDEVASSIGAATYGNDDATDLIFSQWGERVAQLNAEWNAATSSYEGMPSRYRQAVHDEHDKAYIHLVHARIWMNEGPDRPVALPAEGMRWRGRLSEISGWSIGALYAPGIGYGDYLAALIVRPRISLCARWCGPPRPIGQALPRPQHTIVDHEEQ
jgi:hypothetical protein